MKDQINTIRKALELGAGAPEALTALSELERMAGEPVAWGIIASNTGRIAQVTLDQADIEGHNPRYIVPLYRSATPAQQQYEAGDMASAHNDGFRAGAASVAQQPQARPDFSDEWTGYLKDGETPFERFLRERKDLNALTKLYQRALEENERLKDQQPQAECRSDGRCQYAIDHGAEGLGHCPEGKCAMKQPQAEVAEVCYCKTCGTAMQMPHDDCLACERGESQQSQAEKRCEYCDGTGDVHSIDGQWLGECQCQKQPQAEVVQACGHPMSLLLRSAESNEPLYCEACDDKSGRHDAERRETELLDANRRLQEKIGSADALKLHAIEELCQLGYTVKDGELFPPDHLHKLMEAANHPLCGKQTEAVPSSALNPDESDSVTLWAEIWRLREAVKGPDGYATWQDAATAERIRRVRAESKQAEAVPPDVVRDAEPVYAALRIEGPRFKVARHYGRIYEVLAVGCDKKALTAVAKTAEAAYYDLYYGERTLPKAAYEWVVEQVPTVDAAIAAQGEKP